MRKEFVIVSIVLTLGLIWAAQWSHYFYYGFIILGPLLLVGYIDFFQKRQTIRRNFPIFGNFRYLFEAIRPEINQYFVESNSDGVPFSREQRSVVYQRSKGTLDTLPFGTQRNVYEVGYEWVNHSVMVAEVKTKDLRIKIGSDQCTQPYDASIFNIAAMSYGSLSDRSILSLNGGAKIGGFAHNTGEGGLSPHHLNPGGDLIWQIGTGYFSARTPDGHFCEKTFAKNAKHPNVKMIEIKVSQGAKPGHGGILPAAKITAEIATIRNVIMGQDVLSPPSHSAFSTPIEMMEFIKKLRDLSGGKPVGFKICVGKRREVFSICKAMEKTGIYPDFITVDGGEGGTGAAPIEFSNHIGTPGVEALVLVHNALVGFGLRSQVKILATGKITTAFGIIKRLSLGADACYAARSFMMSLGCIQALRCNSNHCPTGVATNNPSLVAGLNVTDKTKRVAAYHRETIESLAHMIGAMGIEKASELKPWHVMRRTGPTVIQHFGEIYDYLEDGDLLKTPLPPAYERAVKMAKAESFRAPEL